MNAGVLTAPTRAFSYLGGAAVATGVRAVAVEAPIEIAYGGQPFAVMMGTPADLEDFGIGFSLTEGIVERLADIRAVEAHADDECARINVALTGERLHAHLARRRAIAGRTGCGICGIEDLAHLPQPRLGGLARAPAPASVGRAVEALDALQPLNALTRAVHAAAWVGEDGAIVLVREDVGRHNALDKCVGALLRAKVSPEGGFFLITSRCSYEMVTKAAAFGACALVSVSAPTSLALRAAEAAGVYLLAVARRDGALHFEGP
jgi:FdhD protein